MPAPIKILLIENDPDHGLSIKSALSFSGISYILTTTKDSEPVAEILNEERPDFILLDYNGDEGHNNLFNEIRNAATQIPVIIISSVDDQNLAVKMMRKGASDFISGKVLSAASLNESLERILQTQELNKQKNSADQELRRCFEMLAEAEKIAKIGSWEYETASGNLFWSEEVLNILGVDAGDVTPDLSFFRSFIHPEDDGMVCSSLTNVLLGGSFNVDYRIIPGNHRIKHINSQGHAIADENGKVKKIIGTLQDLTERKKKEYDLFQSEQISRQSLKVKENFIASMSHEIRTPMNAIMGFANLLYTAGLDKQDQEYARAIKVSGENLLSITDDMLDVSTLRPGQTPIDNSILNLPGLVGRISNMLDPKATEKSIKLIYKSELKEPYYVFGDSARITQVLVNLLGNSIKHTEKGKILFSLRQLKQEGDLVKVEVTVKHPGNGLPLDRLMSVFNSFSENSTEVDRNYGGPGSTLSMAKDLVELQDGVLEVNSAPGEGSSFVLTMMLKKGEQQPDFTAGDTKAPQLLVGLEGKRVLVVEDNRLNQVLVKKVLCDFGLKVDIAENAESGIQLLMLNDYDIVLMDLQMPGMDGYAACEFIRNQFENEKASVPVVAMTAHVFKGGVEKCFAAGMDGYISKPFEPINLYSKILKVLNKHLTLRELKNQNSNNMPIMTQENKITDLAYLKELSGGNEDFLVEMITLFNSQVPDQIQQLHDYMESQDWPAMRALAHKMSPSLAFMGLSHEFTQIKIIEKNAEHRINIEQIPAMLSALKDICIKAVIELSAELKAINR